MELELDEDAVNSMLFSAQDVEKDSTEKSSRLTLSVDTFVDQLVSATSGVSRFALLGSAGSGKTHFLKTLCLSLNELAADNFFSNLPVAVYVKAGMLAFQICNYSIFREARERSL